LVGAVLYGGIEYGTLAEYLWIDVIYIYYSKYNLNQKDKIHDLSRLVVNTDIKNFRNLAKNKICLLFDDNTQTGGTLSDIRTFLSLNWISSLPIVWRHILLSKKKPYYFEWEKLKEGVWDYNILIETLIRAYSWYFKWNKQLFVPIERKKRQLIRNFWKYIKD
jgi:hypoxanthine phosphoribosyltransferase